MEVQHGGKTATACGEGDKELQKGTTAASQLSKADQ